MIGSPPNPFAALYIANNFYVNINQIIILINIQRQTFLYKFI